MQKFLNSSRKSSQYPCRPRTYRNSTMSARDHSSSPSCAKTRPIQSPCLIRSLTVDLLTQHGGLVAEVANDGLLLSVEPAREHQDEGPKWWCEPVHGASLSGRPGSYKAESARSDRRTAGSALIWQPGRPAGAASPTAMMVTKRIQFMGGLAFGWPPAWAHRSTPPRISGRCWPATPGYLHKFAKSGQQSLNVVHPLSH